jgi:tellurite resistance protein TerC
VTAIPEIPTWLSLLVILGTLVVTTVASLAKSRRDRAEALALAAQANRTDRTEPGPGPGAPLD